MKYNLDKYKGIKKRKIFLILLIICIISILFGILFLAILDKNGKMIVSTTMTSYIKNLNYDRKELFLLLKNNVLITIVMWLFGISLFGVIFELIFLVVKSFTLGFSISSFIYTFKLKGIYIGFIYLFPNIFNLVIYFILGFFAINYSIYLFQYIFNNKEYNLKLIMKRYIRVLLISIFLLIISSLVSYFIVPNILKLFTNI